VVNKALEEFVKGNYFWMPDRFRAQMKEEQQKRK
jgi:hypothetical protein